MTHQELLQNMLSGWETYYHQIMNGDFSEVCWKEGHDKTYGTYDIQANTRLKLCCYIFYYHKDVPKELLLWLFREECQNLETNSFQGVSQAIQILTILLSVSEDHHPGLFERAKNANFDCYCGYECETELFRRTMKELPDFDAYRCLSLAYDTSETDYALQFFDMMKAEYVIKEEADCRTLIWWNDQLGRSADNEPLLRKSMEFAVIKNSPWEIISAHYDLLKFFTEQKNFSEACQEFEMLSAMDLSCCRETRLFDSILESCLDLINADIPEAKIIWNWAISYIKNLLRTDSLYGNFYQKLIPAVQKMNPPYAKKIQKQYEQWKKRNKIS
ncbi:MAG: hypothetical protein IJ642_03950 [Oscillospiraceae bacterium]|nr:hypothetical protein [Oscillospiraceae bacterium]